MSSFAMTNSSEERGTGERALRWIGDLDHPFYSDERNRYVWYEASAIAFQLMFLASYFTTGIVLLIAGSPALPYMMATFLPTLIVAGVFQGYLKSHLAEYWPSSSDFRRARGRIATLSVVVLIAGIIRALLDLNARAEEGDSFFSGAMTGVLIGAVMAGVLAAIIGIKKNAAEQRAEEIEF